MLPATLAILSTTFQGRERATAFAAWGATAGVAAAFGPVVGGFLTYDYSWRWSFRINVIIAPLAIVGALAVHEARRARRERASRSTCSAPRSIAVGMFLLVFALSEGGTYGWWTPLKDFSVAGHGVWPASRSVSIMPIVLAVAIAVADRLLFRRAGQGTPRRASAVRVRAPAHQDLPLRTAHRSRARDGPVRAQLRAAGVPAGRAAPHPAAERFVAVPDRACSSSSARRSAAGSSARFGTTIVVRIGLVLYAAGLLLILHAVSLDITVWRLLPGLAFYGIGIGFARRAAHQRRAVGDSRPRAPAWRAARTRRCARSARRSVSR